MQQSTISGLHIVLDPSIDGYNTTKHWKTLAGSPTATGLSVIRLPQNADIASYFSVGMGFDIEFVLTIPTAPTAGQARQWGVEVPAIANRGRLGFKVDGADFSAVAYDENGTALTLSNSGVIPWKTAWTNTATSFRIRHNGLEVVFYVAGSEVARVSYGPTTATRVRLKNGVNDNMDLVALGLQNIHAAV